MENWALCVNKLFLFGASLGNSWEFRPIWALEISASPESTPPTVPKIRYVAGVHGNAAVGPELLLEFASVLCINYGGNPTITKVGVTSRQPFQFFVVQQKNFLPIIQRLWIWQWHRYLIFVTRGPREKKWPMLSRAAAQCALSLPKPIADTREMQASVR